MSRDLTNSPTDRQNILNNSYALMQVESAVGLRGIRFEGETIVLKEQVATFLGVTARTIDNYLERYADELAQNGYEVLSGKRLQAMKLELSASDDHETDFVIIGKAARVGIFPFRAFLNLAMLVAESERARKLRQVILDVVIDSINQRTGGQTKYINQRDEEFLESWFQEADYRKEFTSALNDCVGMGKVKFPIFTDRIYVSIFREKANEYKTILKLSNRDRIRDTMYSEVLDLIAAYECGMADVIRKRFAELGRQLAPEEVEQLFVDFESAAHWKPLIEKARNKMASRDLAFRDALHLQLKEYITPLQRDEFERFLGEKSKELAERLEEAKDVMRRLKERE